MISNYEIEGLLPELQRGGYQSDGWALPLVERLLAERELLVAEHKATAFEYGYDTADFIIASPAEMAWQAAEDFK